MAHNFFQMTSYILYKTSKIIFSLKNHISNICIMKIKLLSLLLLIGFFSLGQVPVDETMRYMFTNGSLVNEANPGTGDLVQTGSASLLISDFNNVVSNAIELNGDSFIGGQTAAAENSHHQVL